MRSSLYIKALFGNTADWMVGGSLTFGANCWNSVFPNGVSSFQFNKQAICLRTEWQSNFWTVDGCLCAHVLMHTYKATQTCVLQTSQIHSWLASSPSSPLCLAAPGAAQWFLEHLHPWSCAGAEQDWVPITPLLSDTVSARTCPQESCQEGS